MRTVEAIYEALRAACEERCGCVIGDSCDMAVRLYAAAAQIQALEVQAALDGVDAALTAAEREALVPTATAEGLARWEAALPWRPAAGTLAERRAAISALLCVDGDSLTLEAVNRAIQGCGIRARVQETGIGTVEVWFPGQKGVPPQFERIRRILLDIVPCHLAVTFCFRYLTWEEFEGRSLTWAAVEAAGTTWEELELSSTRTDSE